MAGLESKSFNAPDETRPFADKGAAELVALGDGTVMKARFEPGWVWSEHLAPLAGTDTCQSPASSRVTTPGSSATSLATWSTSAPRRRTRSRKTDLPQSSSDVAGTCVRDSISVAATASS